MPKPITTALAIFLLCVFANVVLALQVGKYNEVLTTTAQYLLEDAKIDHGNKNLMLGSSSIKKLEGRDVLRCGPWLNRGIGSSTLASLTRYLNWSRLTVDPSVVLIYAGENDISRGSSSDQVFEQYTALVNQLKERFPDSVIHIIGIKLSPRWRSSWEDFRAVNSLMQAHVKELHGVFFHPTPGSDTEFGQTGFLDDGIHLTEQGYNFFTSGFNQACATQ